MIWRPTFAWVEVIARPTFTFAARPLKVAWFWALSPPFQVVPSSEYSAVIPKFSTAALEGRAAHINGTGEVSRDFTYVANVVDGVLRACEAPKAAGEVINVATGGRISLNELLRAMNQICGTKAQPIYQEPRVGDVRDSQADISKAAALLEYRPLVSFEEGLRQTLDWCRAPVKGTGVVSARTESEA